MEHGKLLHWSAPIYGAFKKTIGYLDLTGLFVLAIYLYIVYPRLAMLLLTQRSSSMWTVLPATLCLGSHVLLHLIRVAGVVWSCGLSWNTIGKYTPSPNTSKQHYRPYGYRFISLLPFASL